MKAAHSGSRACSRTAKAVRMVATGPHRYRVAATDEDPFLLVAARRKPCGFTLRGRGNSKLIFPMSDSTNPKLHQKLVRLNRNIYLGRAYVHWTMTVQDRAMDWLSERHHFRLRECLLHVLARYRLACPVYCLMPNHAHFAFIGIDGLSDQLDAIAWLRREWNHLLAPRRLQRQAYDHVLREKDRERDAFADLVGYILRNPVRKELVEEWSQWRYTGACFPGYPKLDPRSRFFWSNFWKAYEEQSERMKH